MKRLRIDPQIKSARNQVYEYLAQKFPVPIPVPIVLLTLILYKTYKKKLNSLFFKFCNILRNPRVLFLNN